MSAFDDFMKIKTLEKELYDTNNKLCFLERANDNLIEQKKQLKELLLVCREMLREYQYSEGDFTIGDNLEIDTSLLLKKIDNVIGEKK